MVCLCICLPGGTTITTKLGVKNIEDLRPLDKVLTLHNSKPKWTTFYTWGHYEKDGIANFLVIKTCNGNELSISSEHLLFVVGEKGKVAKKAGNICPGDKLLHFDENGALEVLPVTEIQTEQFAGIFAPFTMTGHFLANGFLVACYANVDNFSLAHAALTPLRAWHKARYPSGKKQQQKEGIHEYAAHLMKIRNLLPEKLQFN
ncbi:tiggy-winkle hedgehog protein [Folsomia candida]|uniref:Tiggy-winkle hedgehog protein n=1 Tax=Folsomia candida TaxID=158441 RepID=A0A226EWI8_FOLCA|nr:tiggy-winkle hedgehog protein [Folsomia candida]OXA61973.1 Tiggy-winkle hedgehog protein [Folsomia candida]